MNQFEFYMTESSWAHFHRKHPDRGVSVGDIIPGPNGMLFEVREVLNSSDMSQGRVPLK